MKMHITALEVINSKKDVKWLKISALSSDTGEVIETMLEASKVANREELEKAVLSKEDLVRAFSDFEPCEIVFNKRGRVEEIVV